jgi:hypothetical protein
LLVLLLVLAIDSMKSAGAVPRAIHEARTGAPNTPSALTLAVERGAGDVSSHVYEAKAGPRRRARIAADFHLTRRVG